MHAHEMWHTALHCNQIDLKSLAMPSRMWRRFSRSVSVWSYEKCIGNGCWTLLLSPPPPHSVDIWSFVTVSLFWRFFSYSLSILLCAILFCIVLLLSFLNVCGYKCIHVVLDWIATHVWLVMCNLNHWRRQLIWRTGREERGGHHR